MVQSSAKEVDQFIDGVEKERTTAVRRLGALCVEHLAGWEERMQWGMPGYGPSGSDAVVSFNSQKNYISFYPGRAALELHRGKIKGASFGGGCVRFPKCDKIDFEAIIAMLKHVYRFGRSASSSP